VPTSPARGITERLNYWEWNLGENSPRTSTRVATALAADQLMLDNPNGKRLVRTSTYKALSIVLRRAVGKSANNDMIALASYYASQSENALISSVAEIDTNDDGVADIIIRLGRTSTK
jgi:hypothetical protein